MNTTTTDNKPKPALSADIYKTTLTITFGNGQELTIDAATLTDDIKHEALMHGLKQKCVDAAAIARNTDTGRSATIGDKHDAVKEVIDRLTGPNPSWNKIRSTDGGGTSSTLLVEALMRLTGRSRSEVQADVAASTSDEKKTLRANPRIAQAIVDIQRERATDTTASDALLASKFGL